MAADADVLRQVPLFGELTERQLKRLAAKFTSKTYPAGAPVVRQDNMSGVGFFVVAAGEASVTVDGREVARLGAGDHFGELALIAERERTATVTAESELQCLEIAVWDFRELVQSDGEIAWKLLQSVVHTLLDEGAPS
ncbi:MAG TPA: cyclic nucleotide-binding domain-containing protein [Gaiellaceae bacterium]|nr:cyclic nucleotide-binding domain-containing protein [Gaiellaceae bacterium]